MKEKKIIAMFVTSAITLVASLAITFGVFMTLADPVVATGVTRYVYAFNESNNSLITVDGKSLKLSEEIVFQPSSSVIWPTNAELEDEDSLYPVWINDSDLNGATYQDEIIYQDESISSKLKIVPLRISNNYSSNIITKVDVSYNKESLLGKYTQIKVYSYAENIYLDYTGSFISEISSNSYKDYAIIIYADDSANFGRYSIDWGNDYEKINVVISNETVINL